MNPNTTYLWEVKIGPLTDRFVVIDENVERARSRLFAVLESDGHSEHAAEIQFSEPRILNEPEVLEFWAD